MFIECIAEVTLLLINVLEDQLLFAVDKGFTSPKISEMLGISKTMVERRMLMFEIRISAELFLVLSQFFTRLIQLIDASTCQIFCWLPTSHWWHFVYQSI